MFRTFGRYFRRALPLSLAVGIHLYGNPFVRMDTKNVIPFINSERIKVINDIAQYVEDNSDPNKAVVLCQLHEDEFIDDQLIQLALDFQKRGSDKISTNFQFLFVKGEKANGQDFQHYFVIYSNKGEKVISLDSYINRNRQRPELKVGTGPLIKRLAEAINGFREVKLSNITQELSTIQKEPNYHSLIVLPDENEEGKVEKQLKEYLRNTDVKSKNCQKFIVKDVQSKQILGLNDKSPGLYLLSMINNNVLPQLKQKASTFKIGDSECLLVPVDDSVSKGFVFPPIQPKVAADQVVLNLYVNKNKNTGEIEDKLTKQLSKPQYSKFRKAFYYTSEVDFASLTLELNDYSSLALTCFDQQLPLDPERVKEILGNTYEWSLPIKEKQSIEGQTIQKWIKESTGEDRMKHQLFKSQKVKEAWSYPLTGSQYKEKRDEPGDKVIYHYSHHCHGCKKFGGKFQLFAKNRSFFPGLSFYRINNDNNKSEGVRNFNTTPVFVFYKNKCNNPFVYRMPIFTEQLFQAFLRITAEMSLIDKGTFKKIIEGRKVSEVVMKEILSQLR